MKLLVQKFGGTSVATEESRACVRQKIRTAREEGWAVVAVISAMGRRGEPYATDSLLDLFSGGKPLPCSREQDAIYVCGEMISGALLANELQEEGNKCVFLNGGQAGIVTNEKYSEADILEIRREPILKWLEKGYIVLVAGGQGITEQGNFTSIGRGGGDTTACAIGYYLHADEVRIYTDVDGVFTGDPRVLKHAYPIPYIGYEQCLKLAEHGAKVIHPKAVAYSRMGGRDVLSVRSAFTDNPGTRIGDYRSGNIGVTALRNRVCSSKVRDAIFIIGPEACRKLEKAGFERSLAEEICSVDEDCAEVIVKAEHYERLINQIHDSLCIPNTDEGKEE